MLSAPYAPDRATHTDPALTLWIVWGAFLAALVAYALVLVVMTANRAPGPLPQAGAALMLLLAVGSSVAVVVVRRRMLSLVSGAPPPGRLSAGDLRSVYSLSIVSFTLSQTVGVLGLVIGFITGRVVDALPFFVWGAALLALVRPRPDLIRRACGH